MSWSLLPAAGLCHFAALALVLLVLLEALAQVDSKKMTASTPSKARCLAGLGTDHARDPVETASSVRRQAAGSRQHKVAVREDHSLGQISPQEPPWDQLCVSQSLAACSLAQLDCDAPNGHRVAEVPHAKLRGQRGSARLPRAPSPAAPAAGMNSLQKQDLRRPKIHGAVRVSPYQPPTLASLQRLLWVRRAAMLSHIDEVWPNLFLGDAYAARDKNKLTQLGITHVVNVAAGKFQVDTGAKFYRGMPLEYYGIEADDNPFFDLSVYFLPVARYIRTALSVPKGRVLVHCAMGVSRSATVVLAFLMICENMTLVEAIQTVQAHRDICPNSGFLQQLQVLDNRLGRETGRL
ncbi:dual specificity protein phosphatase 13 isoform X4 [Prionailurus iriomotensis]